MKRLSFFTSADAVTIPFVAVLTFVQLIFIGSIGEKAYFIPANVLLIALIIFAARYVHLNGKDRSAVITLFRDWYLVPAILFIYTQASSIANPIHQRDYDNVLIMIDQMMLGVNPTQWISQFAHPLITEILQIAYSSYYLFFIILFFELYRRSDRDAFQSGAMLVVYGFYLSYIGYLLVPAIGPRFTLHDFFATERELPGIFLTEYLRSIVNSGGGIPEGALNPAAFVNRDAFPSGHTQLTMTAIYVAFRSHAISRWWIFAGGSLLIISTIYMRYHYVIDVLAGIVMFFITIWSGGKIDRRWKKKMLS